MTELLAPFGAPPHDDGHATDIEAARRTPVLITEQQVLFATAAAVPLRTVKPNRRFIDALHAIAAAMTVKSSNEGAPRNRRSPSRHDFLEESRMAREMMRL
jgi:hypothetical protein